MSTTVRAALLAITVEAALGAPSTPALAQFVSTPQEYRCSSYTAKAMGKMILRRSRCVQQCAVERRGTLSPFTDCFAPFGGATQSCVLEAEAGTRNAIATACAADCPECYFSQQRCDTGEPDVSNVGVQLDFFSQFLVYCVEGNGGTATPPQGACEDAVAKAVTRLGAARIKCYTRCFAGIYARSCATCKTGQLPVGSCNPPVSDLRTQRCLERAHARAAAVIDASCGAIGAHPACHGDFVGTTGQAWADFMSSAIDGQVPNVACEQ
jgi:hypothetical protein